MIGAWGPFSVGLEESVCDDDGLSHDGGDCELWRRAGRIAASGEAG
jgi:hypothetical protein